MLHIIELLGVGFFAMAGGIEAERKGMDLIGIYAVAFVTALGGGTLRDVLLNRHPLFWVKSPEYALWILAASVAAALIRRFKKNPLTDQAVLLPDAFGLGFFTAVGTAVAFRQGVSPFIAVLMGVMTATFGGVIRDIVCNEVPVLFRRGQLYATCSFFAALAYWACETAGAGSETAMSVCVVVALILRLIAVRFNIQLPL
jgi:uncharacterized membrane protein YeiH